MKIFIVEDDKNISRILAEELRAWGYETFEVVNFNRVIDEMSCISPDLVLMDISLPYFNGYYWTQEIRKTSKLPIIFISSHTEPMDIVQAMEFGADDYITKPIDIAVTRAKIYAVLRRAYNYRIDNESFKFDSCVLDISKARLTYKDCNIDLTKTELMILESLFEANGEIASRNDIIEKCWQGENFIDDNTLAVNITRLRKKLREIGREDLIQTKKGMGYYLKEENE